MKNLSIFDVKNSLIRKHKINLSPIALNFIIAFFLSNSKVSENLGDLNISTCILNNLHSKSSDINSKSIILTLRDEIDLLFSLPNSHFINDYNMTLNKDISVPSDISIASFLYYLNKKLQQN